MDDSELQFRMTSKHDGAHAWELVKDTGVLDLNSSYSYLMWCELFSETSVTAEYKGEMVGFISGFIPPSNPNVLFIWQVAVCESARGNGIGTKMLLDLIKRDACKDVCYVEATVSPSNIASQHLFYGLAQKLETDCTVGSYFLSIDFPRTGHEEEPLYKIGPISTKKL